MSEEKQLSSGEEKHFPSDAATRAYLKKLMRELPDEMAKAAKDAREDAIRAGRDLKFAQASLESLAQHLDDWQASIQVLCRDIQTLWMIGPVWDITQKDDRFMDDGEIDVVHSGR